MEVERSFTDSSNSESKYRMEPKIDPSMLTMFLETCMKLLCDSKAVNGVQELITRCVRTIQRDLWVV